MTDRRHPYRWVGWKEWVHLPDLGVFRIKAKIDTGAYTSALHVSNVHYKKIDGVDYVEFMTGYRCLMPCQAPCIDVRTVRDSSGREENRYCIVSTLALNHQVQGCIEMTLTDRGSMKFPMLLGRSALRILDVYVDVHRSYLCK